ncbi:MAG: hypothetical protein L6R37_002005 [Teloschistes peruensis]|nr:MAG: hypothetical protein L6R37_002005 [Teloschistes peruensis]
MDFFKACLSTDLRAFHPEDEDLLKRAFAPIDAAENALTARLKRGHDSDDDEHNDNDEDRPITDNCDVVRHKINAFITSGERTIGVNNNSYGRFMKLKGPISGNANQVYYAAFRFFDDRRKAGSKPPKKKVKKSDEAKKLDLSGVGPLTGRARRHRQRMGNLRRDTQEDQRLPPRTGRHANRLPAGDCRVPARWGEWEEEGHPIETAQGFPGTHGSHDGQHEQGVLLLVCLLREDAPQAGEPKTEMRKGTEAA